jgi:hypothetical protein
LIGDFDREIDALAADIDQRATRDERVKVLCQIRGIGLYLAQPSLTPMHRGQLPACPSTRTRPARGAH